MLDDMEAVEDNVNREVWEQQVRKAVERKRKRKALVGNSLAEITELYDKTG